MRKLVRNKKEHDDGQNILQNRMSRFYIGCSVVRKVATKPRLTIAFGRDQVYLVGRAGVENGNPGYTEFPAERRGSVSLYLLFGAAFCSVYDALDTQRVSVGQP
jgi:hypothetical protein